MSIAKQRADWNRSAALMAMQAELQRNKKKRSTPFVPIEFIPPALKGQDKPIKQKADIQDLKVFLR